MKSIRARRVDRPLLACLVSYAVVLAAFIGVSFAQPNGADNWRTYTGKIQQYGSYVSGIKVGLNKVFLNAHAPEDIPGEDYKAAKAEEFAAKKPLWWGLVGAMLVLCALVVARRPDHEAVAFSMALVYCLVSVHMYYYMMLCILTVVFVPHLERFPRAMGMMALFAMSFGLYVIKIQMAMEMNLSYIISWALLAFFGYTGVLLYFEGSTREPLPNGGAPSPLPSS